MAAARRRPSSRRPRRPRAARPPASTRRPGRPGRPRPPVAYPRSRLRAAVERRSIGPLLLLRRLPRWLVGLALAALLLAGLAVAGPVGAALLLVVALLLAWVGYLSWPALQGPARVPRVVVVLLVLGAAAYQLARK